MVELLNRENRDIFKISIPFSPVNPINFRTI